MVRFYSSSSSSGKPKGRGLNTVLLTLFLAGGLYGTWYVGRILVSAFAVYGWEETTCTITASDVVVAGFTPSEGESAEGREPGFSVSYRYRVAGVEHTGSRLRAGLVKSTDDPSDAYRLADRYPVGAEVTCRYDPAAPARSYLEKPSPWSALVLLFPLAFVAAAAGGLYAYWHKPRPGPGRIAAITRSKVGSEGCGAVVFSVFLLAGLAFFLPFFGLPALAVLESRSWPVVPAKVIDSQVGVHSGDDGATYSVDVLYQYEFNGRTYHSSSYDFLSGSSSGYAGKSAIVERYPPGSETVCYVDPDEPSRAVLSRKLHTDWLFGLIPLVFVVIGGGGVLVSLGAAWKAHRRRPPRSADRDRPVRQRQAISTGGLVLEPRVGPWGKFFGILAVALFWNGIVGVFVWQWWLAWRAGSPDGCLTLFLIPFVLIGLALLASVPYQLLALFNPRPVLTLEPSTLAIGDQVELSWRFRGSGGRISRLEITVEACEEASYTRGTDRVTDREVFLTLPVADLTYGAASGNAHFTIPADTMHSFESAHNKVVWTLKLHGHIDRWPDVSEEFPLKVEPRPPKGGR